MSTFVTSFKRMFTRPTEAIAKIVGTVPALAVVATDAIDEYADARATLKPARLASVKLDLQEAHDANAERQHNIMVERDRRAGVNKLALMQARLESSKKMVKAAFIELEVQMNMLAVNHATLTVEAFDEQLSALVSRRDELQAIHDRLMNPDQDNEVVAQTSFVSAWDNVPDAL